MARFLVVESEASLRWINLDYIRTIEASTPEFYNSHLLRMGRVMTLLYPLSNS
jgi:hypothetical protein